MVTELPGMLGGLPVTVAIFCYKITDGGYVTPVSALEPWLPNRVGLLDQPAGQTDVLQQGKQISVTANLQNVIFCCLF